MEKALLGVFLDGLPALDPELELERDEMSEGVGDVDVVDGDIADESRLAVSGEIKW